MYRRYYVQSALSEYYLSKKRKYYSLINIYRDDEQLSNKETEKFRNGKILEAGSVVSGNEENTGANYD